MRRTDGWMDGWKASDGGWVAGWMEGLMQKSWRGCPGGERVLIMAGDSF